RKAFCRRARPLDGLYRTRRGAPDRVPSRQPDLLIPVARCPAARRGLRLIAPDLIGMGDSDKIPAGAEPDRYPFASHARYLDAFINEVVGTEPLTLVLHDWEGALGFDWAYRHQERVRAIAYMETFVAPLTLEDLPESFHPTLKAVRSSAGEALV